MYLAHLRLYHHPNVAIESSWSNQNWPPLTACHETVRARLRYDVDGVYVSAVAILNTHTHAHTTAVQNRTSLSQACVRRLHKIVFNRWIWVWLEQVLTNVIFVVRVISVVYGCMVHWLVCWMGCALTGGWGTGYQYCPRSLSVWMLSNIFTYSLTYFVPAHGTLKSDWLSFTHFI